MTAAPAPATVSPGRPALTPVAVPTPVTAPAPNPGAPAAGPEGQPPPPAGLLQGAGHFKGGAP